MKFKITTLFFLLAAFSSNAQLARLLASNVDNGDKQFDSFAFADALEYYQRSYKNDSTATDLEWKIAECYRHLNNARKSEEWYAKIVDAEGVIPIAKYHYAEALKSNGKYDEAKKWFEEYNKEIGDDSRVKNKIDAIENQHVMMADRGYYQLSKVDFNIDGADFSPAFYDEGIVFVSARKTNMFQEEYAWDNSLFLDVYYSKLENDTVGTVSLFDSKINTRMHDGPIDFYNDENNAVFTRNNIIKGKKGRSSEDTNNLQIFFAEKGEYGWAHVTPFEYNNNEYSLGHATVSEDGSLMIFASDPPSSMGGSDLYFSRFVGGGWTLPESLGDKINTKGEELFPFLQDSMLYFASTGHGGLGGLDVFIANLNDLSIIQNFGAPINSSLDDFGLILKGSEGYFSSNRDGNDDIFHFIDNRLPYFAMSGIVVNEIDEAPIPEATVFINNYQFITDDEGRFNAVLPVNVRYKFSATKEHFELLRTETRNIKREFSEEMVLKMNPAGLFARIVVIDKETKELLDESLIKLKDLTASEDIEPLLIEKDATLFQVVNGHEYELMGAKKEYFTGHVNEETTKEKGEVNWKIPLERIVLNKEIAIENIYYDLNKATLRSDALVELDKIVRVLQDNPTIKIELSSHTDSRGGDDYNQNLSQRRAESAVTYIIGQGVDATRMVAKGYGETKPVNQCVNGVQCGKDQHQANRRTEFKVTEY